MTTTATATESAAQRERLIQQVHDALGGDGWAYSNYGYNELVDMRDRLEKVVDIFAPIVARAEAGREERQAMSNSKGYKFNISACHLCGCQVSDNWYVAHTKSGCKIGIHVPKCDVCGGKRFYSDAIIVTGFRTCTKCGARYDTGEK